MTIQIRGVSKDLNKQFRHICLEEGISMTQKLIKMIEAVVEKEDKK